MCNEASCIPSWITYLCIEGVIGAGKTSFCNLLAREEKVRLVLEKAEENPFLEMFYNDRMTYAFQTQLWFLISRYQQLSQTVAQQDLFYEVTVSDYFFQKDRIFATVNLHEEELLLYDQVALVLGDRLVKPNMVVYLQASTEVLLQRIERRGRSYEFNMDPRYIAILNEAYNHFFFRYSDTPLLIVNTDELDFVNKPGDYSELLNQIVHAGRGTTFYKPMTARDKLRLCDSIFYRQYDKPISSDTTIEEPIE